MSKRAQLLDLFLSIAAEVGATSDRDIANLVGVSPETIANWRTGAVQEVKPQKLGAMKSGLAARIGALKEQARAVRNDVEQSLCALEVEEGSGPADLQRQLRDRISYDYLGHRFLYFDSQGAVAWEMLLKTGYEQERWLRGTENCLEQWLDTKQDLQGRPGGPLAHAIGLDRGGKARGIDIISLGPGEGGKEALVLKHLLAAERDNQQLPWITMVPVDVSIPLLLRAARVCWRMADGHGTSHATVLPFCADFEEGPLRFLDRLATSRQAESDNIRLVLILGNVFGNLRDEEVFVRQKLWKLVRSGDFVWIEVGVRQERMEDEPLFQLTLPTHEESAADTCRRLLLEGPYRRWEAAQGRAATLSMRVWVREDDESARIPGSCNFCHDLTIHEERRACTMLYSRRYQVDGLSKWFEEHGFRLERTLLVEDSRRQARVAHLLLRRR